jgi:hypothetical protein
MRALCDQLLIDRRADGTTVTMRLTLPEPASDGSSDEDGSSEAGADES